MQLVGHEAMRTVSTLPGAHTQAHLSVSCFSALLPGSEGDVAQVCNTGPVTLKILCCKHATPTAGTQLCSCELICSSRGPGAKAAQAAGMALM